MERSPANDIADRLQDLAELEVQLITLLNLPPASSLTRHNIAFQYYFVALA
jgi:hypothetical protein